MKFQKVTALLLAACMLFAGCAQKEEAQDVPAAGVAVQVRTVATDNISSDSVVSGQVALENETAVYIMTGALCTEVLVEEGMEVKAGDVICRLDMSTTRENDYSGNTSYLSMDSSYNDQKALL
ncbi:MAG: efflux RND transporter periplasmic adaptor subunit, partial [Oscillospiraceae bacterium]|nr:efflux RND transporter periplasmic adaptor subunit [Oscillospiraceae bacterium]